MKPKHTAWATAIAIASALFAGSSAQADDSLSQSLADTVITTKIETMYVFNDHLSAFYINTTTNDGVVTLTGTVDDRVERRLAEDLAMSVEGVKAVENKLTLDTVEEIDDITEANNDRAERSDRNQAWRHGYSNAELNAAVRTQIVYHGELNSDAIDISADDGVVTLSGTVESDAQKQLAENAAKNTTGVDEVVNELTVFEEERETEVGERIDNFAGNVRDEIVEKRVERRILFNRHLKILDISVEVDDKVCKLSGSVENEEQRDLVINLAENTRGVDAVKDDLLIVPDTKS